MVVISIGLTGTLLAINTVVRRSVDPMIVHQAVAIAGSYLDEISSKGFPTSLPCSSSPPAGGRMDYVSICDYKFIPVAGQVPTDQLGNPMPGLENYTVKVNIDDTTAAFQGLTAAASQVVRIDVTVSNPHMTTTTYSVYRTNL